MGAAAASPYSGQIGGGYSAGSMAGNGSSSGTQTTTGTQSGTQSSSNKITPMSPYEMGVAGNLGTSGAGANPLFSWGANNLQNMWSGGMQPTKAQQKGLGKIRQSTLAADQQGLNYSLNGPGGWLSQVNNQMADRGMVNSSVDSMAQSGAIQNAQNLMNQDVQGANQQYDSGMLNLPFSNANLLTGAASMGQQQQGMQAGINQNLLNTLTSRDMANSTNSSAFNNLLKQTQTWNQQFANKSNSSNWSLAGALGL